MVSGYAQNFIVDGISYHVTKEVDGESPGEVEVWQNHTNDYYQESGDYSGDIVIPAEVKYDNKNYEVTRIGGWAFRLCPDLSSIIIPEGVTFISDAAFFGCSGLTSVTIPNSVTTIDGPAFGACSGLTSITLGNQLTTIGDEAFYACSNLSSITIPNSVTTIGNNAFYECSSLRIITSKISTPFSVNAFSNFDATLVVPKGSRADYKNVSGWEFASTFEEGETIFDLEFTDEQGLYYMLKTEDYSIFYSVTGHTDELNTEIVIPADLNGCPVTTIGYRAFINCSELTSVTIQNNVTSIGDEAFYNCSGLTSVIIPNSMACIGSGAFYKCSGLNSVIIGDSVTSIGDNAFKDCSGLSSITIGNSLTSIGYSAFWGCSNLTSITIPSSVTSISSNAFANCSKLKNVKVVVTDYSELCNNNLVGRLNDEIYQLRIGTIQLIDHDGNEIREYSIPNGVTTINDNAFKSCKGLTSITIPNSVTSIGNSAFIKCSSLTSVTIGNSVTSIGENAFNGCSSLKRVTSCIYTPFAVNAFSNFNAALVVPKGSRDDYKNMSGWEFAFIFEEDEAIFELNQSDEQGIYYTLKADDNSVYYSVAGYYAGLNPEIVIPSELDGCPVKAVEANAFKGCTSLSSVTIPNTVTSIDRRAFSYCM